MASKRTTKLVVISSLLVFLCSTVSSEVLTIGGPTPLDGVTGQWKPGGIYEMCYLGRCMEVTTYVKYNGGSYTVTQIKNAYPNIQFKDYLVKDSYKHKFGLNISSIPTNVADKIEAICLNLTSLTGLTVQDFDYFDYGEGQQGWVIKNKVFYNVYPGPGITTDISGRTVCYGNITGNTAIWIDPSITLNNTDVMDDAYLESANPTYNNGGRANLQISYTASGPSYRSFILRFNLSDYYGGATASELTSAFLNLTLYQENMEAGEYYNVSVKYVDNLSFGQTENCTTWVEGSKNGTAASECEINWNKRPTVFYTPIRLPTVLVNDTASFNISIIWDITEYISYALNNSHKNITLYVSHESTNTNGVDDGIYFRSKEWLETPAYAPNINLNYETGAAPTSWLNVSLNEPGNNTGGPENMSFNFTALGSNSTYNCSINMNGSYPNASMSNALNNTIASFNYTLLNAGTWFWNVTCNANSTLSNSSYTFNYTVTTSTTTTTTLPGLTVALLQPTTGSVVTNTDNVSLNYSVVGSNSTYNCSLNFNGSYPNQSAANILNNTPSIFNMSVLANGTYWWNVTCNANATLYNNSATYNFTLSYPTTTTTTTTAPTTTTTLAEGAVPINPIEDIYAIMIPCFAVAMTITALGLRAQPIPAIIATIFWFASSLWTTNIRFIFDFTVGASPYYVAAGNWEVGSLFMVFGVIMAIYSLMIIVNQAQSVGILGGQKND